MVATDNNIMALYSGVSLLVGILRNFLQVSTKNSIESKMKAILKAMQKILYCGLITKDYII
jgi:hypothetical protein